MTKTVDGVCADCWGQKVIDARVVRARPRTEPLGIFDVGFEWGEPWVYRTLGLATAIGGIVLLAWIFG